ncbi:ankyrin repeat-containing domain protein [Mycena vitilis]|nr:ankyrin repeat-containing domain protein [Mycena vitilis]
MSTALPCAIPADPDISGVGVRTAIYAQNLLSFIPAIWALWDGEVSEYELECVETQSTTILVTAFAILISAMVEANRGLSNFHASIVLDLSWMNNTNTFIYFLLYVQHKSQPGPQQIKPTFSCWIKHLKERLSRGKTENEEDKNVNGDPSTPGTRGAVHQQAWIKAGFRRIVIVLGSLHLSLMASLGIWLWSDPRSFGPSDSCVVDIARIAILGHSVPLGSAALRGWSIAIYSLFLAPGLNLFLPVALFLGSFLGYQTWNTSRLSNTAALGAPSVPSADHNLKQIRRAIRAWYDRLPTTPSVCPTVVGMVFLFTINLIFLVDIELTLRRNRTQQTTGESEWTFGQILAILLLVLPLRDLVETMLARRETKRQDELAQREKRRREEHAASLRRAIEGEAEMELIMGFINNGADVNTTVEACRYPTPLILAASRGDADSLIALLKHGATPNLRGGKGESALISACSNSRLESARLLLQHGADPNLQADEDGTALQAASYQGHVPVVELLLASGAEINAQGGQYGTALQAASYRGKIAIVELLLAHGADVNAHGTMIFSFFLCGKYGTALQAASSTGGIAIVDLLLAHGADVKIQGGVYGTALHAATYAGNIAIVELLLAHGADVNIQGGHYGTALQAAVHEAEIDIVELLLAHGADVNIQGGKYGTALQAASCSGHLAIVQLLLARGADVNVQGGKYGTALQAGSDHLAIVEVLLAHNAEVNLQGGEYGTALRAVKIVKLLLDHGADPNLAADKYGSILNKARDDRMAELLRAHGAI